MAKPSDPNHPGQIAGTRWDPEQYLRFPDHRLRPAIELLDRIVLESAGVVYDLGCGTGKVTEIIAGRWPAARVYGIDQSREMLARAEERSERVGWIEADIETWSPEEPADLVYSNAALHWVADHEALFPRLAGILKAGGMLAVQMPLSWDAPSHRLMRETLADGGPGGTALGTERLRRAMARRWVKEAAEYYDLLEGCTRRHDIWETEYLHVLEGNDPVLEWVKGTGLRPIVNGLAGGEKERFLTEYARRLRKAYPPRADGRTLYPFRRLFIVAMR